MHRSYCIPAACACKLANMPFTIQPGLMAAAEAERTRFFIKPGYRANLAASSTAACAGEEYWTTERRALALQYQHHVYALAARLASSRGCTTGLDLGCGTAAKTARFLRPRLAELLLIDHPSNDSLVRATCPGARFIGADLETCAITLDREMDLIVCADVLEHLRSPLACLRLAKNSLARSGIAVFSTPERDILRGHECMSSPHPDHVREWNAREFLALLEDSGFRVESQVSLPPMRLPPAEALLCLVLARVVRRPRWHGCQVAICTALG